jgi:protein-tyrosine phosphatase
MRNGTVRTSTSDPIRVAWLPAPAGALGVTFAPGKQGPSFEGPPWARDLAADLDVLRGMGVDLLVPLIEDWELDEFRIPTLVADATARGMAVHRLPIVDGSVPDVDAARALVARVVAHVGGGGKAVVHCRGGLGRAGTIGACCLVAVGSTGESAIRSVRAVRPGAIENAIQEAFVLRFAP